MSSKNKLGRLSACVFAIMFSFPLFANEAASTAESHDPIVLAALFGSDTKKFPAVDFELPSVSGSSVRLSKYRGERPVLIYFWATWCPYCLSVRPEISRLREKMGPNEMEILGINVGGSDSFERLKRFQEGHPVSWPILYDGDGKVSKAYGVQGIPLFVLVNKEGNVVYRDNEPPSDVRKYLQ
jgi:cytochrome c biogenesis protein CcmG, thiol:disulfide interchange protein DsbE